MRSAGTQRPGGRTAQTRQQVFDATLAELVDKGYDRLSVESIAQRAGVHKTTVYRRWRTKDRLAVEALEAIAARRIDPPDTGEIEEDLRILARAVSDSLSSRDGAAAVRALVSSTEGSEEVSRIARRFWATRLEQVGPIVERAVARGQLPAGTGAATTIEFLAAPLYYQLLISTKPLTDSAADLAAAATLAAARAGVFVEG